MDAIPTPRSGLGAVSHRLSGRAGRAREQEPKVAAQHVGEDGREARDDLEVEERGVEVDSGFDVVDEVADVRELGRIGHGFSSARSLSTASRNSMRVSSSDAVCWNAG